MAKTSESAWYDSCCSSKEPKCFGIEVFPAHQLAQVAPEPGLEAADGEILVVLSFVDVHPGHVAAGGRLRPLRRYAIAEELGRVDPVVEHSAIGAGDVYILPSACPVPGEEGGDDSDDSLVGASEDIGDHGRDDVRRRAVPAAAEPQDAGHSDEVDVMSRPAGVGAGLSVACDGAADDAGIELAHRLVVHAPAFERPRAVGLQDNVHLLRQAVENLLALVLLYIECDGLLVAVETDVMRLGVAGHHAEHLAGAARNLDSNHLGAEVGQDHGAVPARPVQ